MTCLEHLIENQLARFKEHPEKTYEQYIDDIKSDINFEDAGITAEQCYEITQYVFYTYCDETCDLTKGIDETQLLREKVEALVEIIHDPNFTHVVRCKDCEWWDPESPLSTIEPIPCQCRLRNDGFGTAKDDFCSSGRRKETNDAEVY